MSKDCSWSLVFIGFDPRCPVGVLVLDLEADVLYHKMKLTLTLESDDDQLWWDSFMEEIVERCGRIGGSELFNMLQGSASNFLTVSDAAIVQTEDPETLLESLYASHFPE